MLIFFVFFFFLPLLLALVLLVVVSWFSAVRVVRAVVLAVQPGAVEIPAADHAALGY